MKKKNKFVFGLLSVAAFAGGAYYFVKNILNKDSDDDFEDFEDDFDDFDLNDEQTEDTTEGREYVTINITESTSVPSEEVVEIVIEAVDEQPVEEIVSEEPISEEPTSEEPISEEDATENAEA